MIKRPMRVCTWFRGMRKGRYRYRYICRAQASATFEEGNNQSQLIYQRRESSLCNKEKQQQSNQYCTVSTQIDGKDPSN